MKIVVCGAGGMLGHVVGRWFKERHGSRVLLLGRRPTGVPLVDDDLRIVDLADPQPVENCLAQHRPCVVINCAGVTSAPETPGLVDAVNARLPHRIAQVLDGKPDGSRLIHVSTDGVFTGDRGHYSETDQPDAHDPYGFSKRAGEITSSPHLTIRTSIVGPSLGQSKGLLDWVMAQQHEVRGFTRAMWSGVTTVELARFMDHAIAHNVQGLCHLASSAISKYDLIRLINTVFERHLAVLADDSVVIDRSLRTVRTDIAYSVPAHADMLDTLKAWIVDHPALYPGWHSSRL